jgi:chemotaxis protein methyltransferase CheR
VKMGASETKDELTLNEQDFERFRSLIRRECGIYLGRDEWGGLQRALDQRTAVEGDTSLLKYYEKLNREQEGEHELSRLLASMSVSETQFFRNQPQFDALAKYVIPEITRRKMSCHNRSLRFWSAGCSTGQEAYSIAMTIMDAVPDAAEWNIEVLGTDLNDDALAVAKSGWYTETGLQGVGSRHRDRYFHREDNGFAIADSLRRLVRFQRHNLIAESPPVDSFGTCDVVFCRNVVVFFPHETAKYVIELFYDILNPGAYLFLGHSEALQRMSTKYSLIELGDAFIYRKSLPRSLEGRRFIPDRRMRQSSLPAGVVHDRRRGTDRRDTD